MNRFHAVTDHAKCKIVVPLFSVALLLLAGGCANRHVSVVPPPAPYVGPPQFEPASRDAAVSYADNSPREVLHAGNAYYLWGQGLWFTSADPQGPWRPARAVPREAVAVACTRLGHNSPFGGDYQLCVGPLPKVHVPSSMHPY